MGGVIYMSIFHNNYMVMFVDECSCLSDSFCFDLNVFEYLIHQESLSGCKTLSLVRLT